MDSRHKSLFRWHKSRWWPRVVLSITLVSAGVEHRVALGQDFPDFGIDTSIDSASDLLDEPSEFPEVDLPEVESLPSPTPNTPVRSKKSTSGSKRILQGGSLNQIERKYQEFELRNSGSIEGERLRRAAENPVNRPAIQGAVADFTNKSDSTAFVQRDLNSNEKRKIAAALRQADQLMAASESAFREGQTSLSAYSKFLDLSVKMKAVSSEILDRPDIVSHVLDVQNALYRTAGRQLALLDQPGAERWGAEVLLAEVLAADTEVKLAVLQKDNSQLKQAEAQRAQAARQLFVQRMRDYGVGLATLQEVTQAMRYLLPTSSAKMAPQEREALENALSTYGQLLQSSEETTNGWFASKANMGTNELVSIFMNDGRLHDLAGLGPDGTGLGPDDTFAELKDFDELQSRSASRSTPLAYGEVVSNPFDTAGITAGVGRVDHLQEIQAEVLMLTAQVAQLQGNSDLAQNAYAQSFAANGELYKSRLEFYQNSTASLGDVLQAWMAGQNVRQQWEQSGFKPQDEWTTSQRESLMQLADDTADRHDPRGAGGAEFQLMSSLETFEQLKDFQSTLQREAAQAAAKSAAPVQSANQPFQRVQTFVPTENGDNNSPN